MGTILHKFYDSVVRRGPERAILYKEASQWKSLSWDQFLARVARLAFALRENGVKKGDLVALYSSTRWEWTLIDLAIMSIGAVTVPLYQNAGRNEVEYILGHSKAKILFAESPAVLERLFGLDIPNVETTVLIEGEPVGNEVLKLKDLIGNGGGTNQSDYKALLNDLKADDLASCIYTSGTTGEPKGAELTHGNIVGEVAGLSQIYKFGPEDIGLLFLPLAHVIGRAMQFYQLAVGLQIAYAESIEKLAENIIEVKPAFMAAVPRVLEKIHERALAQVEKAPVFKKILFERSLKIGKRASKDIRKHRKLSMPLRLKYWIVRKLVFSKLKNKLGGKLQMVVSGGAPLAEHIAEFFHAAGVLVLDAYGLTETFAAITANRPDDFKFGTVGKPLPGTEICLSEDGEILVKGPQIFRGYREPVDSDSANIFKNGWLKTGDIGEYSRDGFIRITDRKKELIITAAGKNIAPQRVEGVIKTSPYIGEIIVYGDKKKYLSAIVTLNVEYAKRIAKDQKIEFSSMKELVGNNKVRKFIEDEIEHKNRELARHETIKKFVILDHEFSVETGEMTPTMKLKRKKIGQLYKDLIEGMYE